MPPASFFFKTILANTPVPATVKEKFKEESILRTKIILIWKWWGRMVLWCSLIIKRHASLSKLMKTLCEKHCQRGRSDFNLKDSQSMKQTQLHSCKWRIKIQYNRCVPAAERRCLLKRELTTLHYNSVPPDQEDILNYKATIWFYHILSTTV